MYTSQYPGTLILPGGEEIKAGKPCNLSKEDLANDAVKQWLKDEWLVKAAPKKPAQVQK